MKVASLKTHVVATPAPHIGGMYWIFVELETACGIKGVGEIYSTAFHWESSGPSLVQTVAGPGISFAA